jgi:hypothetical protein
MWTWTRMDTSSIYDHSPAGPEEGQIGPKICQVKMVSSIQIFVINLWVRVILWHKILSSCLTKSKTSTFVAFYERTYPEGVAVSEPCGPRCNTSGIWIWPRSRLKEMSQGSKSHSAPSIPKYCNYFPYFHEWNCNVMMQNYQPMKAQYSFYLRRAIWGPWNSMDLSMECLEFLNS